MSVRGFVSHMGTVRKMLDEMAVAALHGAAYAVENEAKRQTRHGFTSGDFATRGWQSITHRVEGAPRYRALVGSTERHFLFWEMGHHNLFTRRYERVPWLSRAFEQSRTLQLQYALTAAQNVAAKYGTAGRVAYLQGRRMMLSGAAAAARARVGPRVNLP